MDDRIDEDNRIDREDTPISSIHEPSKIFTVKDIKRLDPKDK